MRSSVICGAFIFAGASVNVGRGGDSPLHAAVRQDSADLASLLLDFGADVNLRDGNHQRAVELAPPGGETQQLLMTFEGAPVPPPLLSTGKSGNTR